MARDIHKLFCYVSIEISLLLSVKTVIYLPLFLVSTFIHFTYYVCLRIDTVRMNHGNTICNSMVIFFCSALETTSLIAVSPVWFHSLITSRFLWSAATLTWQGNPVCKGDLKKVTCLQSVENLLASLAT